MAAPYEQLTFGQELSEEQFLEWAYSRLDDSKAFFDPIWQENRHLWDTYAAESLSKADKKFLEQTQRPILDPPFAAGIIDTVIGAELSQQSEPIFRGVDDGYEDEVIAGWYTQLARQGFAKIDALRKVTDAYRSMLVGGYGFLRTYIDLGKVPIRPQIEGPQFYNVYPDPDAVEQNLVDARFFFVRKRWLLEEAQAAWPDKEEALEKATDTGGRGLPNSSPRSRRASSKGTVAKREGVEIWEMQYRRTTWRAQFVDPETGEKVDVTRAEYRKRADELDKAAKAAEREAAENQAMWEAMAAEAPELAGPPPEPAPEMPRIDEVYEYRGSVYRRAFIAGSDSRTGVLLEDKEMGLDEFTIKAVTGFEWKLPDDERVRFYGLMRKIIHIQEWFTRAISQYLELQSRKIKGGGFVEKGAFGNLADFQKFVRESSTPGKWHQVEDGALMAGKIRENPVVSGEPGLAETMNTMKEMFGWISGVSQALQGTMTSDRSNVLTTNMQEQGLQMLLPIRAPRTAFLMSLGRLYARIATTFLPAEELDRILGRQWIEGMTFEKVQDPLTMQEVEQPIVGADGQPVTAGKILKNSDLMEYDVSVDVGAATPSQKLAVWLGMNQHGGADVLIKSGLPAEIWVPTMIKNMPFPGSVTKEMGDKAEAYFKQQEQQGTQEGIMEGFQTMVQEDPQAAVQLIQQLQQLLGMGAPEGGEEVVQ